MADSQTDANGLELEIVLPYDPPEGLHADVYDCLGIVPDVKGPERDTSLVEVILVYVGLRLLDLIYDRLGNGALDRLARFVRTLRNGGRDVRLVVVGAQRDVTFILDDVAVGDSRAIAALNGVDHAAYADGTTLRWDVRLGRWIPDPGS